MAIVHTTTPKTITENGAIRKRSPEWSYICKRFLKTLFSSVDGENDDIWKRWHHQSRHDQAPDHSTMSIQKGGQTLPCGFSIDRRCSVDGRKRYENDKCGHKSFWKRSKTAPFSFENRLVWTGPQPQVSERQPHSVTLAQILISPVHSNVKTTSCVQKLCALLAYKERVIRIHSNIHSFKLFCI